MERGSGLGLRPGAPAWGVTRTGHDVTAGRTSEPPVGVEPTTYALRVRRSTS